MYVYIYIYSILLWSDINGATNLSPDYNKRHHMGTEMKSFHACHQSFWGDVCPKHFGSWWRRTGSIMGTWWVYTDPMLATWVVVDAHISFRHIPYFHLSMSHLFLLFLVGSFFIASLWFDGCLTNLDLRKLRSVLHPRPRPSPTVPRPSAPKGPWLALSTPFCVPARNFAVEAILVVLQKNLGPKL